MFGVTDEYNIMLYSFVFAMYGAFVQPFINNWLQNRREYLRHNNKQN